MAKSGRSWRDRGESWHVREGRERSGGLSRLFRSELNNRETLTILRNRGYNVVRTWRGRDSRGTVLAQSWCSRIGRGPVVDESRVFLLPTTLRQSLLAKSAVFIGLGADVVENVIDRGCGVAQSWRNRIDRGAVLARTWHKRVLSGLSRESRGYNRGAVVAGTWLDRDCRKSVVAQSGRVVAATGMYNFLTGIRVFLHDSTPTHTNVSKIIESALSGRS